MLRRWAIIAATLMVLAPSVILAMEDTTSTGISDEDAYVLIDKLLSLDVQPGNLDHQLQRWKKWDIVLAKYHMKKDLNVNEMKIYLLMHFIAEERVAVHTMEEIHRDILSKFIDQPDVYLNALKEAPLLTESSCRAINRFYGWKEPKQKAEFVREYRAAIMESLGDRYGAECLKHIQELH